MNTSLRRFRRGDTSPERPGLVFNSYNGRFEKWVTPEKLERIRAKVRTPEHRNWTKLHRSKPHVKAARKIEYRKEKNRARERITGDKLRRWDVHPVDPGLIFWSYHLGREQWVTPDRCRELSHKFNEQNKARRARRILTDPVYRERESARLKAYGKRSRKRLNSYAVSRRAKDVNARIVSRVQSRINDAMKCADASKRFRTIELLGCTIPEFRVHLESQFETGMTWENMGAWEIDHRVPLAAFNLADPHQQRLAFNFENCRPLWKPANRRKSDKIEGELFSARALKKSNIIPFSKVA